MNFEQLEPRLLLAYAPDDSPEECSFCDYNQDGIVSPVGDVLPLINRFNKDGGGPTNAQDFGDINFDGWFTPADILCIVNHLNAEPEASNLIRVSIPDIVKTHGLTEEQTRAAFDEAFAWYEREFDVAFVETDEFVRLFLSTATVYVGGGLHAGGIYRPPNSITLHNGWIPPFTHSCTRAPCSEGFFLQRFSFNSLVKTTVHELGHFFGLGHSNNIQCIMHSNAAADGFCQAEINYLTQFFANPTFGSGPNDEIDFTFNP